MAVQVEERVVLFLKKIERTVKQLIPLADWSVDVDPIESASVKDAFVLKLKASLIVNGQKFSLTITMLSSDFRQESIDGALKQLKTEVADAFAAAVVDWTPVDRNFRP